MRVALVSAVAVGTAVAASLVLRGRRKVRYTLHVYDHCPFCNRVEFLMQHFGIPYDRVVYGYGAGAKPDKCDGNGYGEGPLPLTGKKLLPVLQGPGVPCEAGTSGMPESMEICAFLIKQHGLVVPCESGRDDIKKFIKDVTPLKPLLTEDRIVRMPIADWADPRDVAYRRWKKELPRELPPVQAQPQELATLNAKLAEVPALLRGGDCLNTWGWSIDDVVLLPHLRNFTCVRGAVFPPQVEAYLGIEKTPMLDYRAHAI